MNHIEILRFFNKWRRGAAESGALDAAGITPQMIGQAIDACIADAERYQWLRDKSEAVHSFYLSTPIWMTGVRVRQVDVDRSIDAARALEKANG